MPTDAEFLAAHNKLMDELVPNRKELRAALPKGRTPAEMLERLRKHQEVHGVAEGVDEDFARDVEEGMRLFREESTDRWE